jgi:hypothetical protein
MTKIWLRANSIRKRFFSQESPKICRFAGVRSFVETTNACRAGHIQSKS